MYAARAQESQRSSRSCLVPPGAAKFVSYLKEVHALHIIFRDNGEDVASCTFPLVQIGPSEFNLNHEGTIPLLCAQSSQCIGHVVVGVRIAFPALDAFQELECHVVNSAQDLSCLGTAGMGNQLAGEAQRDGADSETDALLKTLFEHLRSNKGQPKEENVDAQQVDIFALVHSACGRCET